MGNSPSGNEKGKEDYVEEGSNEGETTQSPASGGLYDISFLSLNRILLRYLRLVVRERRLGRFMIKMSERVEANGQSGGFWLLWYSGTCLITVVSKNRKFMQVTVREGNDIFHMFVVYISLSLQRRLGCLGGAFVYFAEYINTNICDWRWILMSP